MKTNKPQIIEHVENQSDSAGAVLLVVGMFLFFTIVTVVITFAAAWN